MEREHGRRSPGHSMMKGTPVSDPIDIFAWHRIDDLLTTSGQPTEQQLLKIQALGITHIINLGLHTHERALPDEAASVARLGMVYIHIPVDFEAPTEADYDRFCHAMNGIRGQKVHVHCIVNARVSAFLYRYRQDVFGVGDRDARNAMEAIWRPGGVWAAFIGDEYSIALPHRGAVKS